MRQCKGYPLEKSFSYAVTSIGMSELVVIGLIAYMENLVLGKEMNQVARF